MKFLLIGESKLKVTLNRAECEKYNIKAHQDSEYYGAEVRRTLRSILAEAKRSAGFDIGIEKVLIQIYPTEDGGAELFVTKLGLLSERERRAVSVSENLTTYSGTRGVYMFDTLDSLCEAARAVYKEGVSCDVYLGEGKEYYISISEHILNGFSEFEILSEYGKKLPELTSLHLREHAKLLCEGRGLEIFSRL